MKQYYKQDAKRLWSFHSMKYAQLGLYPINHVHALEHPSVSKQDIKLECTSFLMYTFVYQDIDRAKMTSLLKKIKSNDKLKKTLNCSEHDFDSLEKFKPVYSLKKRNHNLILDTLIELEKKEAKEYFKQDKQTSFKLKKVVIQIEKEGFSQSSET